MINIIEIGENMNADVLSILFDCKCKLQELRESQPGKEYNDLDTLIQDISDKLHELDDGKTELAY